MRWATAEAFVADLLSREAQRLWFPFALVDQSSGEAIGSSSYLSIDWAHKRLEVGGSWLSRHFQGGPHNAEAKLLLLTHAFDDLGAFRVELKTDALNEQSRAAMRKLGFPEEGILRSHMIMPDGRRRDSVYYGITSEDWPRIRDIIRARIQSKGAAAFIQT